MVDPFSTGAFLAKRLQSRAAVIRVTSDELTQHFMDAHTPPGSEYKPVVTIQNKPGFESQTMREIREVAKNYDIRACVCGIEGGAALTDLINKELNLAGNDPSTSSCRRDKADMGEALRTAGVRCARQHRAVCWNEEAATFVQDLAEDLEARGIDFKLVVKPCNSAGTDGVTFCETPEEAKTAVETLMGATNMFSKQNDSVILQEYLAGEEYVCDTVSRNGVHKVTAFYRYDKRMTNGSPFVYYGVHLHDPELEEKKQIAEYIFSCLDALGIRNHAAHSELKMRPTADGGLEPVLIESGARLNGGNGMWLPAATAAYGYTSVSVLADSLPLSSPLSSSSSSPSASSAGAHSLTPHDAASAAASSDCDSTCGHSTSSGNSQEEQQQQLNLVDFDSLPLVPGIPAAWGCMTFLISRQTGNFAWGPALESVRNLPSYAREMMIYTAGKDVLSLTQDMQDSPGLVSLVNTTKEDYMKDYADIHSFCFPGKGLFETVNEA